MLKNMVKASKSRVICIVRNIAGVFSDNTTLLVYSTSKSCWWKSHCEKKTEFLVKRELGFNGIEFPFDHKSFFFNSHKSLDLQ